jgi:hypothetical protein
MAVLRNLHTALGIFTLVIMLFERLSGRRRYPMVNLGLRNMVNAAAGRLLTFKGKVNRNYVAGAINHVPKWYPGGLDRRSIPRAGQAMNITRA